MPWRILGSYRPPLLFLPSLGLHLDFWFSCLSGFPLVLGELACLLPPTLLKPFVLQLPQRLMSPTLVHLIPTLIMTTTKYSKNLTTLDLNKRSMRSRLCSPSLSPICPTPTFSICRRRSHWLCTYINPTFHQPLPSRSPTKRHVSWFHQLAVVRELDPGSASGSGPIHLPRTNDGYWSHSESTRINQFGRRRYLVLVFGRGRTFM